MLGYHEEYTHMQAMLQGKKKIQAAVLHKQTHQFISGVNAFVVND